MAERPVPIGEYTSQIPVQEGLRRIIPELSGASTGPALEDVGNSLQRIVQSEAANYSLQTLSKAQSDWTQQLIDRQQAAQPGAPGFTPAIMKDYGDYVKDAVKGAPNQFAGRILNQQLTQFGHQLSQKAMLFEANARQSHNEETAKSAIETTGNELMNDPSVYQQRLDERLAGIGAMNLDPEVKDKLSTYAQQSLSRYAVQGDIQRDPYKAMLDIQSKDPQGYYKNLTPEQRTQLMDHADTMLHQRVADAERVHMLAKQQQEDAGNSVVKQGILLSQQGGLTADWVTKRAGVLEPSQLKFLLNEASGKETQSDPQVYSDLLSRTVKGKDTEQDIMDSFTSGQLSKEDFTRLTDKAATEFPNSYKRNVQYINDRLRPDPAMKDPFGQTAKANATRDFQDWFRQNPNATDEEVDKKGKSIADSYDLFAGQNLILKLDIPMFGLGKGTRVNPDVDGAEQALVKAYKAGQISKTVFDQQATLLSQWRTGVQKVSSMKPKAKQE